MTGRRLLLILTLLTLHSAIIWPKSNSVEACRETKHVDESQVTDLVWKLLCDQAKNIKRVDSPRSLERRVAEDVNDKSTITSRPKIAERKQQQPVVTTARPKSVTHSAHKHQRKDKKEVAKNQKQSPKSHKDKKTPVVNLKLLGDNNAVPNEEASNVISRQHKAFFVNYPASQRVYHDKDTKETSLSNSIVRKKQKQKANSSNKKQKPESDIYYIRLPPTPYSYVPGLGYISRPPSFSTSALAGSSNKRPVSNPFIKLPLDFVSNGKPTAVYRWTPAPPTINKNKNPHHRYQHKHKYQDSPIIRLNRGPYVFDGRPTSIYVMKKIPKIPSPNQF